MLTYGPKKSNFIFFKIVWPCWGYVWVSWLVILRPSKKGKMVQHKSKKSKLFGHVGDTFGHHHWSFWAFQKIEKLKILCFSKVVYWPLGYDLASSLSIFSPEIDIFENIFLEEYIFEDIFFQDKKEPGQ